MRRTILPGPAGAPGCSSSLVLVSLYKEPVICVISWSGELIMTLGPDQLGLHIKDRGFSVSSIQEGMFHFLVASAEGGFEIHTYKVRITYLSLAALTAVTFLP